MIQISTTAPASWPGATTPLTAAARPVAAVTPVAPVGSVDSARPDEDPTRARRRAADGTTPAGPAAAAERPDGASASDQAQADAQALAEQRRADEAAREAREAADREAIERLRQVLVETWEASAAVVEQALKEGDPAVAGQGARAASLYDEAAQNPQGVAASLLSRRV